MTIRGKLPLLRQSLTAPETEGGELTANFANVHGFLATELPNVMPWNLRECGRRCYRALVEILLLSLLIMYNYCTDTFFKIELGAYFR